MRKLTVFIAAVMAVSAVVMCKRAGSGGGGPDPVPADRAAVGDPCKVEGTAFACKTIDGVLHALSCDPDAQRWGAESCDVDPGTCRVPTCDAARGCATEQAPLNTRCADSGFRYCTADGRCAVASDDDPLERHPDDAGEVERPAGWDPNEPFPEQLRHGPCTTPNEYVCLPNGVVAFCEDEMRYPTFTVREPWLREVVPQCNRRWGCAEGRCVSGPRGGCLITFKPVGTACNNPSYPSGVAGCNTDPIHVGPGECPGPQGYACMSRDAVAARSQSLAEQDIDLDEQPHEVMVLNDIGLWSHRCAPPYEIISR